MAKPKGAAEPNDELPKTREATATGPAGQPARIGKYVIEKRLGAGGMGAVYLAVDTTLKRQVALKVLPKDKASNPTLVKRFKAEALAAAHLRHENIVTIYEAGDADGFSYIALEFVDGTDVANLVKKRGLIPVKRSIDIVRQTVRALDHAFQHKIVHRDIKPGNILVRRDGMVKLADMGLARVVDETMDTSITRTGTTVGTVDFMAPEQARNSKLADIRSDIYSLGCTWFYMLTGSVPYPEGSVTNKLRAHAEVPLPDPRGANPLVPDSVVAVMRRMTEKDPARRYQRPSELLADLAAAEGEQKHVSDSILSEDAVPGDTQASDAETLSTPRRPRTVADLPVAGRKSPKAEDSEKRSELANAVAFYAVVGLAGVLLVAGIVWLVQQFGSATDVSKDNLANPFANAGAAGKDASKTSKVVAGQGNPQAANPAQQQTGGGQPVDPNATDPAVATPPGVAVDQGTGVSRVIGGGGLPEGPGERPAGRAAQDDARARAEAPLLPGWLAGERMVRGLAEHRVQAGGSGKGVHADLNRALAAVSESGAVVTLVGSGPFMVRPVTVENKNRIVLRAHDDSEEPPLVVLLPPEQGNRSAFLEFVNTTLELENVHLAADVTDYQTSLDDAMIHVKGGNLLVEGGSLSAVGQPVSPMSALRVSGRLTRRDSPGVAATKIALRNVVVRGNMLAALHLDLDQCEAVMQRCVLYAGAAPCVVFGGAPKTRPEALRRLYLASTTACSTRAAVQMAGDPDRPVPTSVLALNSLLAAPKGADNATLVQMQGWNHAQQKAAMGKQVTWKNVATALTGWKSLVRLDPEGTVVAAGYTDWQLAWQDPASIEREHIQDAAWPAEPIADICEAPLSALSPLLYDRAAVKTADGGKPGCLLDAVNVASLAGLHALGAGVDRPELPGGLFGGGGGVVETLRVDLAREDLGKFLSGRKLGNGTIVIATGAGIRTISPILIDGAWVRIRFEQAPGAPLVIAPKRVETGKTGTEARAAALITVNDGGLELENACLNIPASDRPNSPRLAVAVSNGDLVLYRCRVQGPQDSAGRSEGLLRWSRDGQAGPPRRPFEAPRDGYLVIYESFLLGSGSLIEADLRRGALFIHHSVAASAGDLLALGAHGADSQVAGAVDLRQSTFSAANSLFQLNLAEVPPSGGPTIEMFADRCVFGPALRSEKQRGLTTMMTFETAASELGLISWWETHCGYAADVGCFLRGAAAQAEPQDFESVWRAHWGEKNVVAPLLGPRGVVLKSDLPTKPGERAKLEPIHWALHPSCKASTWDHGEGQIGALVDQMQVPSPTSAGTASKASGAKPSKGARKRSPPPVQGF